MARTNRERIDRGFQQLAQGLRPFFEREMLTGIGKGWEEHVVERLNNYKKGDTPNWDDPYSLLIAMWVYWNDVFMKTLGHAERSHVSELREVRNDWAHHNKPFSSDDTYRALDSMHRLLEAVSAPEEAKAVEDAKNAVMRLRFEEQGRYEQRKAAKESSIASDALGGLTPWRDVVEPHRDVQSGTYPQAEFAADLWRVYKNEGSLEYRDPKEFFKRTYITEGLRQLLTGALTRLGGDGGDPVIELQTNFGGGKTHSMLALYHLFSGEAEATALPGVEPLLKQTGTTPPKKVNRAVLVGNKISPGRIHAKDDGTEVRTLWGEIAWQLGGAEGYALVAEDDQHATNPGDALTELLRQHSPCLILIDEWVAYARQLHDEVDMPGGSFDTQFTFAQTLTEAVKAVPEALLVVSIPASDIEVGGERGQQALVRLQNAIGRVQSPWRPATAEESFEIVRRRLFQEIPDDRYRLRDGVIRSFSQFYQENAGDFPAACREKDYERRMKAAYPIHPELFDRLYEDWSSLERFQRTRGVLRLMAKVIHELWERGDDNLLILPAMVPLDAAPVQTEVMNHLDASWSPVIEKDVDGASSLPLRIDNDNPNLGRYSAARRVARTIFMGTVPKVGLQKPGISDARIRLGCAQPGESSATFGDALRRLSDQATHLYVNQNQYWYNTQPSVNRVAQDRALQYREGKEHEVHAEIVRRLREEAKTRGPFSAVHAAPTSSGDIPDEDTARLVILGPAHAHVKGTDNSEAITFCQESLQNRGNQQRTYRNMLVFMAPDAARLSELEEAAASFLAWSSIVDEQDELNLDTFSRNQARTKRDSASNTVAQRVRETYRWTLAPTQPNPKSSAITWVESRLQSHDPLPIRAAKKLENEEELLTVFSATRLRMAMDQHNLWRGDDHVSVKQLWEDLARYVYLPRLSGTDLLLTAIQDGVGQMTWADHFAYAEAWDENAGRYRGLRAGEVGSVHMDGESVIIKPDTARAQQERDAEKVPNSSSTSETTYANTEGTSSRGVSEATAEGEEQPAGDAKTGKRQPQRFHGTVELDAMRASRDVGLIVQEVVQHLTSQVDADVDITLEIQAHVPGGIPGDVVRIVSENARTLNFKHQGFEEV